MTTAEPLTTPKSAGKNTFAVYDLVEQGPIKTIHEAAERGDVNWITRAVGRSIDLDINKQDRWGRTALHWAADCGQIEAAEALMDYGISGKLADGLGRLPVHLAARNADSEMLKVLLKDLPEAERLDVVNKPDLQGITPVYLAFQKVEEVGTAAFDYLMESGARYDQASAAEASHKIAETGDHTLA